LRSSKASRTAVRERVRLVARLELQQETLPQVAGADAGGIELLDDPQHLLGVGDGEELRLRVLLRLDGVLLEQLVGPPDDLLRRGAQVAVLRDVADELLREELLARGQVEQPHLLPQVVRQILGLDRDGLDVLPGFAHVARGRAVAAVVQEDVLPVRLIVVLGLLLLLDAVLRLGQLRIVFGLDQLQEGVAEQLLLQVLL